MGFVEAEALTFSEIDRAYDRAVAWHNRQPRK